MIAERQAGGQFEGCLSDRAAVELVGRPVVLELTQAGPVRVRCLGRVLRSSPEHSGEVGVAAAIERYEFMRNGESAA